MSVLISDLGYYGAADMPEADTGTTGGAINFNLRVEMTGTALSPAVQFDIVSSASGDTATKIIFSGRNSSGVIPSPETLTANGTTKVTSTNTYERLLSALVSGAPSVFSLTTPGGTQATGDLALLQHTGQVTGTAATPYSAVATTSTPASVTLASLTGVSIGMIFRVTGGTGANQIRRIVGIGSGTTVYVDRNLGTALDSTSTYEVGFGFYFPLVASSQGVALTDSSHLTQCLGATRLFVGATAQASGGSTNTWYEKFFINNNNQTTALTSASVIEQALSQSLPGSVTLDFALTTALNDTGTVAERLNPGTAPSGVTSYSSGSPGSAGQTVAVPSPGNLPESTGTANASGAQGVWMQLIAPAGSAAWESAVTMRTTGSST